MPVAHQIPSPMTTQNGTLLGCAVFPNLDAQFSAREKRKDHHSSGSTELSTV